MTLTTIPRLRGLVRMGEASHPAVKPQPDGLFPGKGHHAVWPGKKPGGFPGGGRGKKGGGGAPALSFPVVEGAATGGNGGSSWNFNAVFPAEPDAGDVIVILVYTDQTTYVTTPANWLQAFQGGHPTVGDRSAVLYKFCDGTEGTLVNVALQQYDKWCYECYRITGGSGLVQGHMVTGSGADPDPPSQRVSWGVQPTLWLSGCGWNYGTRSPSAAPSGYNDLVEHGQNSAHNGGADQASAWIENETDNENPGVFTMPIGGGSSYPEWNAYTIGVEAVGGAGYIDPGAHRYWRVRAVTGESGGVRGVAEVEWRASVGGADLTGSGTAIANDERVGFEAALAYDNDPDTEWSVFTSAFDDWLGYDFGVGNEVEIAEIELTARNDGFHTQMIRNFDVWYSDDATTWYLANVIDGQAAYSSGESREFAMSWV